MRAMSPRSPFFAACVLLGLHAVAQYEPDSIRPLPLVCDVFVLPGGQLESMYAVGLEQWRTLLPASALIAGDLSDHKYDNRRDGDLARASLLAGRLSFRMSGPSRVKRSGAYLRAGFAFQSHAGNDLRLRKETRVPFDTLASAQTGGSIFIDSLTVSTYTLEHDYKQLALDASVIFMKEYPKRWALYGGAGAQLGIAFEGVGRVRHTVERLTDPHLQTLTGSGSARSIETASEEFHTKGDMTGALYASLGVSYRLGLKRPFWRALNLCYEMCPSLIFGGVPELDTGARAVVANYFGLRVDLVK